MTFSLICLDGIDASGKSSVAAALAPRLKARVFKVPDLSTPTGELIKRRLVGDYRPDALSFALLHTANMFEMQEAIRASLSEQHTILVRWRGTSIAYGISDGVPEPLARCLADLLMPADISFYLSIPVETSFERKREREEVFERDRGFLAEARRRYEALATEPGWVKVDATRSLEAVVSEVAEHLSVRCAK